MNAVNVGAIKGEIWLDDRRWRGTVGVINRDIQGLGTALLGIGVVATAGLTVAVREFASFDRELRKAASVIDATEEDLRNMGKAAVESSIQWNMAAEDTTEAFLHMGRAGLTVTEQLEAFNSIVVASKAMLTDMQVTAEGVIQTMLAFKIPFAETEQTVNIVSAAVNKSVQSLEDMLVALSYAAKPAQQMNNTLSETSAMLSLIAQEGITGSKAGTALRFALTALASPVGDAQMLLWRLSIATKDASGAMLPLMDVIDQLRDRLTGMTEEYQLQVLETLFGRRALPSMIVLFQQGSKAVRDFAYELEHTNDTAMTVGERMMKAFSERAGQLWRTIQDVARALGEKLAPSLTSYFTFIQDKMGVLREWIRNNGELVTSLVKATAQVALTSVAFGMLLLLVPRIIQAVKGLIMIIASPFAAVVIGILALKIAWDQNFMGMQTSVQKLIDKINSIPDSTGEVLSWLEYRFNKLGTAIIATGAGALAGTALMGGPWGAGIGGAIGLGSYLLRPNVNIPKPNFGALGLSSGTGAPVKSWEDIVAEVKRTFNPDTLKEALGDIGDFGLDVLDKIPGFAELNTSLKDLTSQFRNFMYSQGFVQEQTLWASDMGTRIQGMKNKQLYPGVADIGIKEMEKKFRDWYKAVERQWDDAATQTKNSFTSLTAEFTTMQQGMVDGWADAIAQMMQKGASFRDFMDNIWNSMWMSFSRMIGNMLATQAMDILLSAKPGGGITHGEGLGLSDSYMNLSPLVPKGSTPNLGAMGTPKITVITNNNGAPVAQKIAGITQQGRDMIIQVVQDELQQNPAFKGAFAF
uniref:Putative tail protein n=2 Tax=viral metagenome TaxID=1070528 RepID=A0A6M3JWC1_9ZZZZ